MPHSQTGGLTMGADRAPSGRELKGLPALPFAAVDRRIHPHGRNKTMARESIVAATPRELQEPAESTLRQAMRQLPGGISVVTAGSGKERGGLTLTSAVSLSTNPQTVIICVNRTSSTWPIIRKYGHFCVNILGPQHVDLANRFAGRAGIAGAARYLGGIWDTLATGAGALVDAAANIDCEVEETLSRHSHVIVVGAVKAVRVNAESGALVYWNGDYLPLSQD